MAYILRVADRDGNDAEPSISAAVDETARRLFSEICRNIVRAEMRLQGEIPPELLEGVTIEGTTALAHDSRRFMDETLDYLGGPSQGTWMSDTFPDVMGMKRIASLVLEIHERLQGNVLVHGEEGEEREFKDIDVMWVSGIANALYRAHNGGLMGVIVKDPKRRDHWAITTGGDPIPILYVPLVPQYDIEDFAAAGIVIAKGTVIRDEDGGIVELRAVENCYSFPGAVFLRAIAPGADLGLVGPLEAVPSYYARTKTWYLKNDEFGIEGTAKTWDECVARFHREFVRLWRSHAEGSGEDNPRIHGMLDEICPFP